MDIIPQLIVNSLITGSIYALVTAGIALVYSIMRVLNFAHGHMLTVGAYLFMFWVSILDKFAPTNIVIFTSLAVMLTCCSSVIISFISYKGFIKPFHTIHPLLPFVTTIALSTILESLISMFFGVNVQSLHLPGDASGDLLLQGFEISTAYITSVQVGMIATAVVLLSLLAVLVHRTPWGRGVVALSLHRPAFVSLGKSSDNLSAFVFCMGGALAAIAGIFIGLDTSVQPTMGASYSMKAFAAMIVGGLGSVWGAVFGSYLLGFFENFGIGLDFGGYSIPAGYKDAFAFVMMLVVLLWKPEGIFNSKRRKV